MPEVTVLVNTYNRRDYLERVLAAYTRQTVRDFEVVVADDGSDDGTDEAVARLAPSLPYPLRYVRHEHRGHRRARILNLGIAEARCPLILFTDCDSLPRRDVLEVHLRRREPRRILVGGYIRLTREYSAGVGIEEARRGDYEAELTFRHRARLRFEHMKILFYLAMRRPRRPHNMGLNYSAWRADLLEVNGYDENFEGWGNADGDVRDRMRMAGIVPKSAWAEAVVFHLWHKPHPTKYAVVAQGKTRNALYAQRPGREIRCRNGLEKLPGWEEERAALEAIR